MPYMYITTNVTVDEHTAELIKKQMGHAIEAIRGKSEQWLAVRVEGDAALWFAGTDEPAAVVQTGIYGSADHDEYESLTGRICEILDGVLSIDPARIYVQYAETEYWGWNGRNF